MLPSPPGAPRQRYLPPPTYIPPFRLELQFDLSQLYSSDNEEEIQTLYTVGQNSDYFMEELEVEEEDEEDDQQQQHQLPQLDSFFFDDTQIHQSYFQKLWRIWTDLWENNQNSQSSMEEICWVEHLAISNGGLRPSMFPFVNRYILPFTDSCCSVCLETLSEGETCAELKCSHRFHSKCLGEWFKSKHCCPNCRYDVCSKE